MMTIYKTTKTAKEAEKLNNLIARAEIRANLVALLILIILSLSIWAASGQVTNRVTVAWDANPETNIVEYVVHYGEGLVISPTPIEVSAGTNTQQVIDPLAWETDFFFYVTAKNDVGLESDPSEVLLYTTPPEPVPPAAPGVITIKLELLTSAGVAGPFTNLTTFQFVRTNEFFLAEMTIIPDPSVPVSLVPPPPE
jgi:hypothetical protein